MDLRSNRMNACRFSARNLVAFLVITLAMLPGLNAEASYQSWSNRDGTETILAELEQFDFETKEIVCRDTDGTEHRLATADLNTSSRLQILFSQKFVQSFPDESFTREQGRFILLAVGSPALFMLLSFFLCAGILLRSVNPIRAVIGWCGAVVLGSFLVSFYVFLSGRSPGAALGITLFGIVVVSWLLSLYVSIIYRTTVLKGLKVLVLHFFGALFLIFGAILVLQFGIAPETTDLFLEEKVFKPVGLT